MTTTRAAEIVPPERRGYAIPEIFATTDWLSEHLDDRNVALVDTDDPAVYTAGHIPGAANPPDNYYKTSLDDRTHIQGPEQFAATMSALGISDDSLVVAYDRTGGLYALRLMWALHYYRHTAVKMLDGGLQKWVAEGREAVPGAFSSGARARFSPREPDRSVYASLEDVLSAVGNDDAKLMDVRSDAEWLGKNKRGGRRGGRIPGAKHLEWVNFHTGGDIPVIKPADELRALLYRHGIEANDEVITYCQGGIRAAHAYWTLKLIGMEGVRNYDASWRQWGNDPKVPIENES